MYATTSCAMNCLEIAGRHGTRIHRPVVQGLRIRQDHDHLFRALREGAFDRLRHVDFVRPLFGADGVTVQRVDDGIAARFFLRIAGRQKDKDVAINCVAFQIAFQCRAVNFDVLDRYGLCTGNGRQARPFAPARRVEELVRQQSQLKSRRTISRLSSKPFLVTASSI